jgi:3-hydroxyacyl-CoA dehydrogenase/enoyl-CoA hydratase/3-hydroxybutyryl-CoA epimerase
MPTDGYSLTIDPDGIAAVGFDLPGKVNIMNDDFMMAMPRLLGALEARRSDLRGVILTSHKSTFFAGGDLALMLRSQRGHEQFIFDHFELLKSFLRRLEKLELPLVAAINGTALGGGYELCLACHRRIALANPRTRIGLPEVNFGILPAAGGVIRLTAVLGILPALEFLVTGRAVTVDEALQAGLIHEVADTEAAMMAQAKAWILANPGVRHSWDQPREPGAHRLSSQTKAAIASIAPWLQKTVGSANNAAVRIADIAAESLCIDFDVALRIETRGFVELVVSDDAHAKISSFFEANSRRRAG